MVTLVTIVIDSCTRYNQGKYKTPTLDLGNWDQQKKKKEVSHWIYFLMHLHSKVLS